MGLHILTYFFIYLNGQLKAELTVFWVIVHRQCQLVKRFEKQINGLNIGIKSYLEVNLETNGVYHAI